MIKVAVLTENTSYDNRFLKEHGLSLFIECNSKKILFDSGQSNVFLKNGNKLGVNFDSIDTFVLSHGHFDHGGGIPYFLEKNGNAPIYVGNNAFEKHYAKRTNRYEYIGLPQSIINEKRIIISKDEEVLDENTFLFSGVTNKWGRPRSNEGLYIQNEDGSFSPDSFEHEQNLSLKDETTGKTLLVTGCSHNGILNILDFYYKTYRKYPDVVIGGFHLSSRSGGDATDAEIEIIGKELLKTGAVFYTGHCTGEVPFIKLRKLMGKKIHNIHAGTICML